MNHHASIEHLKKKLIHASRFDEVWTAFYELSASPGFIRASDPVEHDMVRITLLAVCQSICAGQKASLKSMRLMKYHGSPFYHGLFYWAGYMGNVIYFDDIDIGMAILCKRPGTDAQYVRFSCAMCSQPASGQVSVYEDAPPRHLH